MSDKWHGGKGSKPRPISDRKQFEDNWDKIFGNKENKPEEENENNPRTDMEKLNKRLIGY
ncbi:MAG: hypothetical protein ACO3T2_08480 [Burkholderiaceae bacterium]